MSKEDINPEETREWLDSMESVIRYEGIDRAHYLLEKLVDRARRKGAYLPFSANTAYINTISPARQVASPGDHELEHRLRSYVRWNALATVLRANAKEGALGGHIASFASSATLYDVGVNHFFRGSIKSGEAVLPGDLVYFQGHSSPGIYAHAYLEGRISEAQLDNFRMETHGNGLSSYPHPWLMPDFWQFPTVSMGLGPIMAIYQARFMRYLENRNIIPHSNRKVWAFMGDGEMDEPESLGAISLAEREQLDNLIFVINCNLQRLDGPVRGNGKIIQELESGFRGAGWNVIKVIWGSYWDPLLARDKDGLLKKRMEEIVDGDYQTYRAKSGSYIREHFFGKYPELKALVSNITDEDIWRLNRGGHDPHKVYAAYHAAFHHQGQPTVILAKTIKGYGMGSAGQARNIAHQQKKIGIDALRNVRDHYRIPVDDADLDKIPFYKPPENSEEMRYLRRRIEAMGGSLPKRNRQAPVLAIPDNPFATLLRSSGERDMSTTMAFVRILMTITRDKTLGKHIVPIVPDESRTFGMESMFRQLGIYSRLGQLYNPEDADQMMYYREDVEGQILQEGICEAGALSSWIAAATSYSNYGLPMMPFYIFYSMFGFQRVGDLAWAAADMRARGFLIGGTAGRTTLNGEGLQHADGHSQIQAQFIPNCRSYDPTFAYELATIVEDGLIRMLQKQEDVYYYITVMNENYAHPAMPPDSKEGILKGAYLLRPSPLPPTEKSVRLLASGSILNEALQAAAMLEEDFSVAACVYSTPSFNLLARDGQACARWNTLHPGETAKVPYITELLSDSAAPVIAASDYLRIFADQIREFVPARYVSLGTDGFGRSDTRWDLRRHFEVDRYYIAYNALSALAAEGKVTSDTLVRALEKYRIDADKSASIDI